MKRDILFSVALHLTIVLAAAVTSPLSIKSTPDYGEVIRVTAISPGDLPDFKPEAPAPVDIPPPSNEPDIPEDIPVDDPVSKPKVEVEKPKKKEPEREQPKPQKSPETEVQEEASQQAEGTDDSEIDTEATGSGGQFSGATVDNAAFDYPYWFRQTFTKIQRAWRNPVTADFDIVCVVRFYVLRTGRVIDPQVVESSGVPSFDRSCLESLERASPFPPFPREFRDEIIGITIPFKYEPR